MYTILLFPLYWQPCRIDTLSSPLQNSTSSFSLQFTVETVPSGRILLMSDMGATIDVLVTSALVGEFAVTLPLVPSCPYAYVRTPVWCGVFWSGVMWCDVKWCVLWYGMVWCGVVWYGMIWCDVMWCGVMWYGVVWCGVVWCSVVWCGVVWCGVMWSNAVLYSIIHAMRCSLSYYGVLWCDIGELCSS